ncbi:E3 ubiquitin-protein ligase RSL1-like [Curcuma longa]|uniref:E3 ubiquitin-protein ligase RSL1-like n=1 Tax=Curcuma longa TaxID=136217 RepID=UPI003D9F7047
MGSLFRCFSFKTKHNPRPDRHENAAASADGERVSTTRWDNYCSICIEDKYSFEQVMEHGCPHTELARAGLPGGRRDDVEGERSELERALLLPCFCGICMEEKYSFQCVAVRGCDHAYCAPCVSQYVATKVAANEAVIGCPDPECKAGVVDPEACRFILPDKVFHRWGDRLCEEAIAGPARFYCPFRDCSALLIHEEADANLTVVAKCLHCRRELCARCRVPWHENYTCEDYRSLVVDKSGRSLVKLAKANKWQRCPYCGFFVQRSEGCARDHSATAVQVQWMTGPIVAASANSSKSHLNAHLT